MNDKISIKSYLCTYDHKYISIQEAKGKIADPKYIEGAIEIKINDKIIVSIEYWDDVDDLWHYIIHHLKLFDEAKEEVSFGFPDSPLCTLTFGVNKNHSIINIQFKAEKPITGEIIDNNKTSVNYKDFMLCLISSCREFFNKLFELEPKIKKNYKRCLDNLEFLEKRFNFNL